EGVRGVSHGTHGAVVGVNDSSTGGNGGWFESTTGEGLRGLCHGVHGAVVGINDAQPSPLRGNPPDGGPRPGEFTAGAGGWFESTGGEGVRGTAHNPNHGGVVGVHTQNGPGLFGTSTSGEGVHAETQSTTMAALAAYQTNVASGAPALFA